MNDSGNPPTFCSIDNMEWHDLENESISGLWSKDLAEQQMRNRNGFAPDMMHSCGRTDDCQAINWNAFSTVASINQQQEANTSWMHKRRMTDHCSLPFMSVDDLEWYGRNPADIREAVPRTQPNRLRESTYEHGRYSYAPRNPSCQLLSDACRCQSNDKPSINWKAFPALKAIADDGQELEAKMIRNSTHARRCRFWGLRSVTPNAVSLTLCALRRLHTIRLPLIRHRRGWGTRPTCRVESAARKRARSGHLNIVPDTEDQPARGCTNVSSVDDLSWYGSFGTVADLEWHEPVKEQVHEENNSDEERMKREREAQVDFELYMHALRLLTIRDNTEEVNNVGEKRNDDIC